jgi:hypothetical protein
MNKKLFTFTNDVPAKGSSLLFRHFQEREQSVKKISPSCRIWQKRKRNVYALACNALNMVCPEPHAGGFGGSLSFETRHPKCGTIFLH